MRQYSFYRQPTYSYLFIPWLHNGCWAIGSEDNSLKAYKLSSSFPVCHSPIDKRSKGYAYGIVNILSQKRLCIRDCQYFVSELDALCTWHWVEPFLINISIVLCSHQIKMSQWYRPNWESNNESIVMTSLKVYHQGGSLLPAYWPSQTKFYSTTPTNKTSTSSEVVVVIMGNDSCNCKTFHVHEL